MPLISADQLDPIYHEGLRQVLGAFRTSPVDSLYAEAHEAPLQLRCEKLALQYYTKLKSCTPNSTYDCNFNPKYEQHFEKKEESIKPFDLRVKSTLEESKIYLNNLHESNLPQTPPWIIKKPEVPDHLYVFTDCSKENNKTACAAVLNETITKKALPRESSIFTAEVCAIYLALDISMSKHKKFIIFSDSLFVLLSLSNKNSRTP